MFHVRTLINVNLRIEQFDSLDWAFCATTQFDISNIIVSIIHNNYSRKKIDYGSWLTGKALTGNKEISQLASTIELFSSKFKKIVCSTRDLAILLS